MIDVKDLIGIPYKVHGRDKDGMDCYGVAIEVMKRIGKTLPDVFYAETSVAENAKTALLVKNGLPLRKIEYPSEGCLIDIALTGNATSHVGVYVGDGMFIHATKDVGVCLQKLSKYKNRIKGYYIIGED